MRYLKKDLPSFMRMRELKKYEADGKLHYIETPDGIAGFYVVDGSMFKCLFVDPQFRGQGIASQIIKNESYKQTITIATTKRMCGIKRIIVRLGFVNTGIIVQGKQSQLEIWTSQTEINYQISCKSI